MHKRASQAVSSNWEGRPPFAKCDLNCCNHVSSDPVRQPQGKGCVLELAEKTHTNNPDTLERSPIHR